MKLASSVGSISIIIDKLRNIAVKLQKSIHCNREVIDLFKTILINKNHDMFHYILKKL